MFYLRFLKRRMKVGLILLLIGMTVASVVVGLYILSETQTGEEPVPNVPPNKVGEQVQGTTYQGATVPLTYQVQNKCSWDYHFEAYCEPDNYFHISGNFPYLMESDGDDMLFTVYEVNGDFFYVEYAFEIYSPYTELSKVYYDYRCWEGGGTLETEDIYIHFYSETDVSTITIYCNQTFIDGELSLSSEYVVDGKIHGKYYLQCDDTAGAVDEIKLELDRLCFEYDTVTENRRVDYMVSGGMILETLTFQTWDYRVEVYGTFPNNCTVNNINPDSTGAGTSTDPFICLTPNTYTVSLSRPVLATANLKEVFAHDFDTYEPFNYTLDYDPTGTITAEAGFNYTKVVDGSSSVYIRSYESGSTSPNGLSHRWMYELESGVNDYDPTKDLYMVISGYWDSNTGMGDWTSWLFIRFEGSYDIIFSPHDDVGGSYEQEYPNQDTDRWVTNMVRVPAASLAGNLLIDLRVRVDQAYTYMCFDGFALYQSSVDVKDPITGTCRHITPYGYTNAGHTKVHLGLWDAGYAWKEYQENITDGNGVWSFDPDSFDTTLTAQNYMLYTWVYADANGVWGTDEYTESVTDWSCYGGALQDIHVNDSMREGQYSVEGIDIFDTSDFCRISFDPEPNEFMNHLEGDLFHAWVYCNDTGTMNYLRIIIYDDSAGYMYRRINVEFGYNDETWAYVVFPIDDAFDYTKYDAVDGYTPEDADRIQLYSKNNTATDAVIYRCDSLNILQKFTFDTFTVYQLGMTGAGCDVYSTTGDFAYFTATGETYATQLYDIYLDDSLIADNVGSGTTVYYNATIGTHTYACKAVALEDGSKVLESTWKNGTYTVTINDWIRFSSYESENRMRFGVETDLSPCYLKAWDNGSLVIPVTSVTGDLWFSKLDTYGYHNVTVQVGSDSFGWQTYYTHYEVTKRIVYLAYYDAETGIGTGIDYNDVVTLVNGTQQFNPVFYVEGTTLNITILDYYNNLIDQNTSVPYSQTVYMGLTWYEVTFINEGFDPIRLIVWYGSRNITFEVGSVPEVKRFLLRNYTVWQQYIFSYNVTTGEPTAWETYESVTYELGTFQQVVTMKHIEWGDILDPSAAVAGYLDMGLGILAAAAGIFSVLSFGINQFQHYQVRKAIKEVDTGEPEEEGEGEGKRRKKSPKMYRDGKD